jgi:mono/diheme cytochrome c family protein
MTTLILQGWFSGCRSAAAICGMAVAASFVGTAANAADKPQRSGPPPIVYQELPNACARCHKSDGRGGPAYGGFAADLRASGLDHEGLVQIITVGVRDRGMPEFKSVLGKREIDGIATYIAEHIIGVYYDGDGNRITAEEAAALKEADKAAKE